LTSVSIVEPNGVVPGGFQGFGAVGADDLTGKTGIDQVRNPADVIDVGMGQKQKVDGSRRHWEPVEVYLRIMALGDAGFGAQVGDGDVFWDHRGWVLAMGSKPG